MVAPTRLPRWLAAINDRGRAPQKAPPSGGALSVQRWGIPPELRNQHAWAAWRYEYEHERWSKPPYNPVTGEKAEPSESSTWEDFDAAYSAWRNGKIPPSGGRAYDGVSFALDPRWGIVGVDLDHVSEHKWQADRIVKALNSYTEQTPSGDGLRIFVKGTLPEGRRRRDWIEMYVARRFLTVTGQHVEGTPETIKTSPHLLDVWRRWVQQNG
jgi:putative DNA primase/helicase